MCEHLERYYTLQIEHEESKMTYKGIPRKFDYDGFTKLNSQRNTLTFQKLKVILRILNKIISIHTNRGQITT